MVDATLDPVIVNVPGAPPVDIVPEDIIDTVSQRLGLIGIVLDVGEVPSNIFCVSFANCKYQSLGKQLYPSASNVK